jgi:hypothetical protein
MQPDLSKMIYNEYVMGDVDYYEDREELVWDYHEFYDENDDLVEYDETEADG